MNYAVTWLPEAEEELADIWLQAIDRAAVTAAAHAIDLRLALDPEDEGESRDKGRRVTFEKPLAVLFEVLIDQNLVQVANVWHYD